MLESVQLGPHGGRSHDDRLDIESALMSEAGPILPLLPILFPLVGAGAIGVLPSRGPFPRIRRWMQAVIALSACGLLVAVGLNGVSVAEVPFHSPFLPQGEPLEFSPGGISLCFAVLFSGIVALVEASALRQPAERQESALLLIPLGAGIAAILASNLLALCLAWVLLDMALLGVEIVSAQEEDIPYAVRNLLVRLLSVVVLVIAAALLTARQGNTRLSRLALTGTPLGMLMLAAVLRLGIYPLPGGLKRHWLAYLASLCAGGCLWLRVASLTPAYPSAAAWIIPLAQAAILVTALVASLSPDSPLALPSLLLNGSIFLVLAPMLDPAKGTVASMVTAVNLGLCLASLRMDRWVRLIPDRERWARLPLIVALASLIGCPFTLGFVARWLFLKLCWTSGWRGLVLTSSVAYLLVSVPGWQRFRWVLQEIKAESAAPHRHVWIALVPTALVPIILVFLGLAPELTSRAWPGLASEFAVPSLGELLSGSIELRAILTLTVTLVPLLGGYALHRVSLRVPRRLADALDPVVAVLELDWLYAAIERVSARFQRLSEQVLAAMEGPFCLGWALLWGFAIAWYLAGR